MGEIRTIIPFEDAKGKESNRANTQIIQGLSSIVDYAYKAIEEGVYLGVYSTINPIAMPQKGKVHTCDVLFYNWFFVDIDPTAQTSKADLARAISTVETALGATPRMVVDSGRGIHLYFRCVSENTPEQIKKRKKILRFLNRKVKNCKVDPVVFNPDRIVRLPGSLNRKTGKPCKIALIDESSQPLDLEKVCLSASFPAELPIESAKEGERNNALFLSAKILGSRVKAGDLAEDEARSTLEGLALKSGLGPHEIHSTISSGLNHAKEQAFFDLGEGSEVDLGAALVESLSPVVCDQENLYRYNGKHWELLPESALYKAIQRFNGVEVGAKLRPLKLSAGMAKGAISFAKSSVSSPGFFDGGEGMACFDNGAYVFGKGLKSFDQDLPIRHLFPFGFNPKQKKTPLFDTLIETSCGGQYLGVILQLLGIAALGLSPQYKRAFLFWGNKGTGKSTLLDVISSIVPQDSIVSIVPQDFEQDFKRVLFSRALLNACHEINEKEIVSDGYIKSVISCERTQACEKFKPNFTFSPKTLHVFCCNGLPPTANTSDAIFDRFFVVPFFGKSHRGASSEIKGLAGKIIKKEKKALICKAIRYLEENPYINPTKDSLEAIDVWSRQSCSVWHFFLDSKDVSRSYPIYRSWALENGFNRPVARPTYERRMLSYEDNNTKR